MAREEQLDWLYRLRSEIYVYMPKEWLIPMTNALDAAIDTVKREEILEDWTKKCRKFEAEYEARLKADMVAMLTEIQLEIEERENPLDYDFEGYYKAISDCSAIIQQKINVLRGGEDGENNN